MRELITDRLAERYEIEWWEKCVSEKIRDAVSKLKEKEVKIDIIPSDQHQCLDILCLITLKI